MAKSYPGYDDDEPRKPYPGREESFDVLGVRDNQPESKENKVGVAHKIEAKFGIPYKSILAFFSVFVGQLLARATVNDIPVLPENLSGWFSLIGGSFVAAAVIYFKANVYTTPQAEKKVVDAAMKDI